MQTTILTNIKPDNPAFRNEFFGPVASFFRVKDEAAAIALANDPDFGLGGSVWTKDGALGKRIVCQIDIRVMFVNTIDWSDAELPFGRINVLVNNTGIGYFAAVEESEEDEVRKMFDLNEFGTGRMIWAALPVM